MLIQEAVVRASMIWLFGWLLVCLAWAPSVVWADEGGDEPAEAPAEEGDDDSAPDDDAPEPAPAPSDAPGLQVIDHGVSGGYVRKPIELRLRRSSTYTWVTRGLLFSSEVALAVVWAWGGEGQIFYVFLWPSFAATTALLSVSQARRALREHRSEPPRPYWRTAGIITLCTGTAVALWTHDPATPEITLWEIGLAQLLGTLMIQLQGWRYRRDIKHKVWPPWLDLIDREKQARRVWVPVVAPTRGGGALVGAALLF